MATCRMDHIAVLIHDIGLRLVGISTSLSRFQAVRVRYKWWNPLMRCFSRFSCRVQRSLNLDSTGTVDTPFYRDFKERFNFLRNSSSGFCGWFFYCCSWLSGSTKGFLFLVFTKWLTWKSKNFFCGLWRMQTRVAGDDEAWSIVLINRSWMQIRKLCYINVLKGRCESLFLNDQQTECLSSPITSPEIEFLCLNA